MRPGTIVSERGGAWHVREPASLACPIGRALDPDHPEVEVIRNADIADPTGVIRSHPGSDERCEDCEWPASAPPTPDRDAAGNGSLLSSFGLA